MNEQAAIAVDSRARTKSSLLQRIRDPNDTAAWAEFYEFYWDLVIGWAKMQGCTHSLAKDVFQETIMSLIKNIQKFEYNRQKGCFRSYLKTIVARRVTDAYRRDKRYITEGMPEDGEEENESRQLQNLPDTTQIDRESSLDTVWLKSVLSQAIRQCCKKVDHLTYKSFCLHVIDGMDVKEVAGKLKIGRSRNVYEHKRRFMEILKREFVGLLEQLDLQEIKPKVVLVKNTLFEQALEELLKTQADCRATGVFHFPPSGLFDRLEFIRSALAEMPRPEQKGAYLFLIAADTEQKVNSGRATQPLKDILDMDLGKKNILVEGDKKNPRHSQWFRLPDKMTIGRTADNDMVLAHTFVSGRHASIRSKGEAWILADEHSTNGVYLNGNKLADEKILKEGDIIQITSDYQFIFYRQD